MSVGDAYVFPGFLTPVLTQLFFPNPPITFPTCFCRGERRKYAGKKSRLNLGSNSQPPGHESDTLTTEPPGRLCGSGLKPHTTQSRLLATPKNDAFQNILRKGEDAGNQHFLLFQKHLYLTKNKFQYLNHICLSSANAFSLDQSKILSFGKAFRIHNNTMTKFVY